MLLRELEYTPQQAHSSDVVALAEGAEESTLEMGVTQKVRHLLCELGGLLPFFADNDGEALRSLVAATLSWLQRAEGTIVEVNSQGDAETQPVNMTPHSLFGESHRAEQPAVAETVLELDENTESQEGRVQSMFWNLRADVTAVEVPSSAESPPELSPPPSDNLSASAVAEAHSPSQQIDEELYYQRVSRRRLLSPEGSRRRAPSDARTDDSD